MSDPFTSAIQAAVREVILEQRDALAKGALPRLLAFADGAKYLGISDRYLREMVSEGRFKVVRHKEDGNKYLDRWELDAYIEQRKRGGEAA